MAKLIKISVRNKVAVADGTLYVCGNSDFVLEFDFDSDWSEYITKTARFVYRGTYVDVVFQGNVCPVPIISNVHRFYVGVYAGDLRTTTPASVEAKRSILCGNEPPAAPHPDIYAQIQALFDAGLDESRANANAAAASAAAAEESAQQAGEGARQAALSAQQAAESETEATRLTEIATDAADTAAGHARTAETFAKFAEEGATAAGARANSAANSATIASTYCTNAQAHANNAAQAANNAGTNSSRAQLAAKDAKTSEANAKTQAKNAKGDAEAAASSASRASRNAVEALQSAARAKKLADSVGTATGLQADWGQNDPTVAGYVQNRTHWAEFVGEVILPEMDLPVKIHSEYVYGLNGLDIPLVAGEVYRVVYNGVDYDAVCIREAALPNASYLGDLFGVEYPFAIVLYDSGSTSDTLQSFDKATSVTLAIKQGRDVVHPIPAKFLRLAAPDGTVYQLTVSNDGSLSAVPVE